MNQNYIKRDTERYRVDKSRNEKIVYILNYQTKCENISLSEQKGDESYQERNRWED